MEELNELLNILGTADISKWPIEDQLRCVLITNEFIKQMKPYLIKNEVLKNESTTSYLFKL